jgi:hypothetical protein
MTDTRTILSRTDCYGLARAMVGLPWTDVPVSPLLAALLTGLNLNTPADMSLLRRLLGSDLLRQVLAENPNAPLPASREHEVNLVPPLPEAARLTADQEHEGSSVGRGSRTTALGGASARNTAHFHGRCSLPSGSRY